MLTSIVYFLLAQGCAPPPLPAEDTGTPPPEVSIQFLFPESRDDVVVCPDMVVVVDVDGWEMGTPDGEGSPGHWHLKDASGTFMMAASDPWLHVSLGTDAEYPAPKLTSLSAALATYDHNELSTVAHPGSTATTEFLVGATEDCVGGDIEDTGSAEG